jgi:kinesin family member 5
MEEKEDNTGGNVRVICRFRPLNAKEIEMSETLGIEIKEDNQNMQIISKYEYGEPLKFCFDYIFGVDSRQLDVYDKSAKPIVEAVMQGFNGTVFAYGQTSSGKTFTMTGLDIENPELMGIIPRMITNVFDQISASETFIEYTVKVSYCEIYLEKIRDLLDISKNNLKVHEDKTRGVFIAELTEKYVCSDVEVYEIMKFGLENRNVGSTDMNAVSSRSHSIFLITITQTNKKDYIAKTGKLYMVDLAGSEKVGKTNVAGKRLEEAKNINKSLTMLGLVIYSLTDGKSTHIPYRDSKLTRVLQDSLGGNSKTSLIITCSPSPYNEAETISTLRFGMRAKAIKNTPKINREYTVAELKLMLAKCREELNKRDNRIKLLEDLLNKIGAKVPSKEDNPNQPEEARNPEYDEIIAELEDTRTKLAEEVKISTKLRIELAMNLDESNHNKATADVLTRQNVSIKEKFSEAEKIIKEKDNLIEKLTLTKEALEKEIFIANTKIIELENKACEKNNQNQTNAKLKHEKNVVSPVDDLKDLLKKEKEAHAATQKELQSLRVNLNELINKKYPEVKVQELAHDEILRKERDKWIEERKSLMREMQIRVERIIELEIFLDNSKESYKNLESYMSEGERALKRKTDTLERNLEQLTLMYHQLITQKSQLQVEKQLADKKLSRVGEKTRSLELEVDNYKNLYEESQQKIAIYEQEITLIQNAKDKKRALNSGNIKKTIQGGNYHSRLVSSSSNNTYISND